MSLTVSWTDHFFGVTNLELRKWPTFTAHHVIFELADGRILVEMADNVIRLESPARLPVEE